jgi:hypothetical protein
MTLKLCLSWSHQESDLEIVRIQEDIVNSWGTVPTGDGEEVKEARLDCDTIIKRPQRTA